MELRLLGSAAGTFTTKPSHQAVCLRVTIAVMKHHDQSNLGRKGFMWLMVLHHSHHGRKSGLELKKGRDLEAGAEAEAMEECC